ncbi:hypothetical protein ISCGN_018618 [Ixodes scapularis]
MSLKTAWIVLQILPLLINCETSGTVYVDRPPSAESPWLHSRFASDIDWNHHQKTTMTSPGNPIKPDTRPAVSSGGGSFPRVMSLKTAWIVLQILPLLINCETSGTVYVDRPPSAESPWLHSRFASDIDWNHHQKTTMTSPGNPIKPDTRPAVSSGGGSFPRVMSLKTAWIVLQILPLLINCETSGTVYVDRPPSAESPWLHSRFASDIDWNHHQKTTMTSPGNPIKPDTRPAVSSGGGSFPRVMSLKTAWIVLQILPLLINCETSGTVYVDRPPSAESPWLHSRFASDIDWNHHQKTTMTSPGNPIKPDTRPAVSSGGGSFPRVMSLKTAWIVLQILPLLINCETSGTVYVDRPPSAESPWLHSRFASDIDWNHHQKTTMTSPGNPIKPDTRPAVSSGGGSFPRVMSLKTAWIVLQILPLLINCETSGTVYVDRPPSAESPWLHSRFASDIDWNHHQKTTMTSPGNPIKPDTRPAVSSGGGSFPRVMSLKTAWIVLQILPLLINCETSGTVYVDRPPSAESPWLHSRFASDIDWNHHQKTTMTSPGNPIKPDTRPAVSSGGGSFPRVMSLKTAWIVLQILPLLINCETSGTVYVDRPPSAESPWLHSRFASDIDWNHHQKTTMTSPGNPIKPDTRPAVSSGGGSFPRVMSLKTAWIVLQILPLLINCETSGTVYVDRPPSAESPWLHSRFASDIDWNHHQKTTMTSPGNPIKPDTRPAVSSGGGSFPRVMSLKTAWIVLQILPLLINCETSGTVYVDRPPSAESPWLHSRFASDIDWNHHQKTTMTSPGNPIKPDTRPAVSSGGGSFPRVMSLKTAWIVLQILPLLINCETSGTVYVDRPPSAESPWLHSRFASDIDWNHHQKTTMTSPGNPIKPDTRPAVSSGGGSFPRVMSLKTAWIVLQILPLLINCETSGTVYVDRPPSAESPWLHSRFASDIDWNHHQKTTMTSPGNPIKPDTRPAVSSGGGSFPRVMSLKTAWIVLQILPLLINCETSGTVYVDRPPSAESPWLHSRFASDIDWNHHQKTTMTSPGNPIKPDTRPAVSSGGGSFPRVMSLKTAWIVLQILPLLINCETSGTVYVDRPPSAESPWLHSRFASDIDWNHHQKTTMTSPGNPIKPDTRPAVSSGGGSFPRVMSLKTAWIVLQILPLLINCETSGTVYVDRPPSAESPWLHSRFASDIDWNHHQKTTMTSPGNPIKPDTRPAVSSGGGSFPRVMSLKTAWIVLQILPLLINCETSGTVYVDRPPSAESPWLHSRFASDIDWNHHQKTTMTSPGNPIKPDTRPAVSSGGGSFPRVMSLKTAWIVLQILPLLINCETSGTVYVDRPPSAESPWLHSRFASDIDWNHHQKTTMTSPGNPIKPDTRPAVSSGGGSFPRVMSLKTAWIVLQILPLLINCETSGTVYVDRPPSAESPWLHSRFASDIDWNHHQKTTMTSPGNPIKPDTRPAVSSGGGSFPRVMSLKTAWIVLQILPLLINCETSGTVYVDRPPSAESPWLHSRFASDIDWNHHQKTTMTSPGNPIKPDTRPAVSSGGGSFPRVMSLKTAWIVLQILPLLINCETSGTVYVDRPPSAESPWLHSRFASDIDWNHHQKTTMTSPGNPIKPDTRPAVSSGGGSFPRVMSLKTAWIVLQILPLLINCETSGTVYVDRPPSAESPWLHSRFASDIDWNHHQKTTMTSPGNPIKPDTRPAVSSGGGSFPRVMSLKTAWIVLQILPLLINCETSGTVYVDRPPSAESPWLHSRFASDIDWNHHQKTTMTSPGNPIKPDTRPAVSSGGGSFPRVMSLKTAWIVLQILPLLINCETSGTVYVDRPPSAESPWLHSRFASDIDWNHHQKTTMTSPGNPIKPDTRPAVSSGGGSFPRVMSLKTAWIVLQILPLLINCETSGTVYVDRPPSAESPWLHSRFASDIDWNHHQKTTMTSPGNPIKPDTRPAVSSGGGSFPRVMSLKTAWIVLQILPLLINCETSGTVYVDRPPSAESPWLHSRFASDIDWNHHQKTTMTSPGNPIKPDTRPAVSSGGGSFPRVMSLKTAWIVLQILPLLINCETSGTVYVDRPPSAESPWLHSRFASDIDWNHHQKTTMTSPGNPIKPDTRPAVSSGGGSFPRVMSLKTAWIVLQILPLLINCETSGTVYVDRPPSAESPWLHSRFASDIDWNHHQKTTMTSPGNPIKPDTRPAVSSGGGSFPRVMSLKTAWIVLQILPLLINCETSGTVYVDRPPSAESPWLHSRFASDIDWNHHQKTTMTSPGNPIKPDTRPAVSSGGGSFPRVMSLKTAWIVLQILPLLINCETSGTVYVDRPPSAESPWLHSRFASDIDWNHHQKTTMTSPGNPIKPDTRPAVSSGGGSFPRVMSLKTAWIVLQILPLLINCETSGTVYVDRPPSAESPWLHSRFASDIDWNHHQKTTMTSPGNPIKPDTRPAVSSGGGSFPRVMSLKTAWIVLQILPLLINCETSGTVYVDRPPSAESPWLHSRFASDIDWNHHQKTTMTSPGNPIKPDTRPAVSSGGGSFPRVMSLKTAWIVLQILPLLINCETSGTVYVDRPPSAESPWLHSRFASDIDWNHHQKTTMTSPGNPIKPDTRPAVSSGGGSFPRVMSLKTAWIVLQILPLLINCETSGTVYVDRPPSAESPWLHSRFASDIDWNHHQKTTMTSPGNPIKPDTIPAVSSGGGSFPRVMSLKTAWIVLQILPLLINCETSGTVYVDRPPSAESPWLHSRFASDIDWNHHQKTTMTSPGNPIKPDTRPAVSSGGGSFPRVMSLKTAWIVLQILPLLINCETSGTVYVDRPPSAESPWLHSRFASDIDWNHHQKTTMTSPGNPIKPDTRPAVSSGGGSFPRVMSLKTAWIVLQILPLLINCETSGTVYVDRPPSAESPWLHSRFASDIDWNHHQKTTMTSPGNPIKPDTRPAVSSGGGSFPRVMSLKTAWIVLQILPLLINCETSGTVYVDRPPSAESPWLHSRFASDIDWNHHQKTTMTSPGNPIKPDTRPAVSSGGGSFPRVMSLKTAWIVLQILPLLINCETSGTVYVDRPPSAESPWLHSRFASDIDWNHHQKTTMTSPGNPIKPDTRPAVSSGGGSFPRVMSLKTAWIVLQILPLLINCETSGTVYVDRPPSAESPWLHSRFASDIDWNHHQKTTMTSPGNPIKPDTRPAVSSGGGSFPRVMSLKTAWIVLQILPLLINCETSGTVYVDRPPSAESPWLHSRFASDIDWNHHQKTMMTSSGNPIKPDTRPAVSSGGGSFPRILPLLINCETSGTVYVDRPPSAESTWLHSRFASDIDWNHHQKTTVTSLGNPIKPDTRPAVSSGGGSFPRVMSLETAWIVLQILPLLINCETSGTVYVDRPSSAESPWLHSRFASDIDWNYHQKTTMTSPGNPIKPDTSPAVSSGGGSFPRVMSLKTAWIVLQILPLLIYCETSGSVYVDPPPSAESPWLHSRFASDIDWNHHQKTTMTSPGNPIKPDTTPAVSSRGGSFPRVMSLKTAWIVLQILPLLINCETSGTVYVDRPPRAESPWLHSRFASDIDSNHHQKTTMTSSGNPIKPDTRPAVSSGGGSFPRVMSLKSAWIVLQILPLLINCETSVTVYVDRLPSSESPWLHSRFASDIDWNQHQKTTMTSPGNPIKPDTRPAVSSGGGSFPTVISLNTGWIVLQVQSCQLIMYQR